MLAKDLKPSDVLSIDLKPFPVTYATIRDCGGFSDGNHTLAYSESVREEDIQPTIDECDIHPEEDGAIYVYAEAVADGYRKMFEDWFDPDMDGAEVLKAIKKKFDDDFDRSEY